jgi:hypothetical protein
MPTSPVARWEPYPLRLACSHDCRSQQCLGLVLAQFDVEKNARYRPEADGRTWCNLYVWDATRALECEVPHWVSTTGAPCRVGAGRELSAAGVIGWLRVFGAEHGWQLLTDPSEAAAHAEAGRPVVVTWEAPASRSSHVAMLMPPADGELRIAQAGAQCLFDVPLARGFGGVRPLQFWWHQ